MEIGEVIGWRAWRVVEDEEGARLASVLYEDRWPVGGPLEARCEHDHRAPAFACTCGIYAARHRRLALPYLVGRDDGRTLGRVLGLVALSGDVIEHRDGWRASHARSLRVWASPALADALTDTAFAFDLVPTSGSERSDLPPGEGHPRPWPEALRRLRMALARSPDRGSLSAWSPSTSAPSCSGSSRMSSA